MTQQVHVVYLLHRSFSYAGAVFAIIATAALLVILRVADVPTSIHPAQATAVRFTLLPKPQKSTAAPPVAGAKNRLLRGYTQRSSPPTVSMTASTTPNRNVQVPPSAEASIAHGVTTDGGVFDVESIHQQLAKTLSEQRIVAVATPRGVLQEQRDNQFHEEVTKAARPDCKEAYRDAGLIGAAFLLHDALADKGCKW